MSSKKIKLHLGCGERYLEGYHNIDFPPTEHTVQTNARVDEYADILKLRYPVDSVEEIRLHHVFEHFDRPTALALLCHWHLWLKDGGLLVIETPDLQASLWPLVLPWYSYSQKQVILRHLFGSHEAYWATHRDGWYVKKFQRVLSALGFDHFHFEFCKWKMTRNITVRACKARALDLPALRAAAVRILRDSMVDEGVSETRLWQVWQARLDAQLTGAP